MKERHTEYSEKAVLDFINREGFLLEDIAYKILSQHFNKIFRGLKEHIDTNTDAKIQKHTQIDISTFTFHPLKKSIYAIFFEVKKQNEGRIILLNNMDFPPPQMHVHVIPTKKTPSHNYFTQTNFGEVFENYICLHKNQDGKIIKSDAIQDGITQLAITIKGNTSWSTEVVTEFFHDDIGKEDPFYIIYLPVIITNSKIFQFQYTSDIIGPSYTLKDDDITLKEQKWGVINKAVHPDYISGLDLSTCAKEENSYERAFRSMRLNLNTIIVDIEHLNEFVLWWIETYPNNEIP